MEFLMSVQELNHLLSNKREIVVVDVRFDLNNHTFGQDAYKKGHIPGAIYLDLNKDLSGSAEKHGGSHPLPDAKLFAKKLGEYGIDTKTNVVIYDQANEMFAPRLWFMLHHLGHEQVYVLEGGMQAWLDAGFEVTKEIPAYGKKQFVPQPKQHAIVHMKEVKDKVQANEAVLIDSRARERYLGKVEPMYKKAGHIPGAKNYFWKDVMADDNKWKRVEALHEHFASLPKDKEIIVSCGSGVSACPNIMGLKMAGFTNVKLYPGSFSDWISYEENKVETKEQ
ncbi:sulfurtransferase [Virgibacillus soli]|uniref:Sulfurtransferase n=1 Tax=Paracerasibacillus soli TaxID=480284 RepID=A0ABU5CVN7_9BACI|nr:sulfurtransferase [Virgibacillus soli]MDY0410386.1 sulfurtransferase [Virgibacillus soli]